MCKAPAFVYPSRLTVTRSLIGFARMYASTPTLSSAWRILLARVSKTSGVELDIEIFLERQHEAEAARYPRLV